MKEIRFSDGYIELKENGNTYLGETAHDIRRFANQMSREFKREFDSTLTVVIISYQRRVNKEVFNYSHL
jgi:hypothetical protein